VELRRRGRRIPYVQQMEATDCGAACLAMTLGYHGRLVPLKETRERTGSGRGGVSARAILEAARQYGLRGRGVKLEPEDLRYLPTASILHWGLDHFVLLDRVTRKGLPIVDPAAGPRLVPWTRVAEQFTGIALTLEPGDRFEEGGQAPTGLRGYLTKLLAHRALFTRVILISLMVQLFALSLPLLTGVLVDEIVPLEDRQLLTVLAVGLLAVVGFHFVATLLRSHLLLYLRTVLDTQLSLGFMDHLVSLPYAFFLERPAGDLLVRYESNRKVRETLTAGALSSLFDGTLVSLYLVLLLVASPPMGLLVLVLGGLQVALFLFARRRYRELTSQDLEVRSRSQSQLVEMLSGMETLKALGSERRSVERWSHRFVDELNVSLARGRLVAWVGSLRGALELGSPLAVLAFGGYQVLDGRLSLGLMLALNALAIGFLGPLSNLVSTALGLQELRSHVERLEDVMTTPPEQDAEQVSSPERLAGAIALERVSFRYGPRQRLVLQEISLGIEPGQKIAIVGKSGAGKSTLARLMVGLYRPTSGRILYDDFDLAGMDLQAVRSQIGVVTQSAHIFGTSIRSNIALADPGLPMERAVEAARLAEIHDEILALPMGYDTLLIDGGASLSGGQRQRIALARALVRRPRILLLDEATSDLDTITESRVMANLADLQCTRIFIAHRLSTVVDADLILLLDGGRLVESGTHAELLARKGGYAELVAAQLGPR
jgi:ABC-type bacteriocin/lantibiotic exporter with double-glycine peptidase domain